MQWNELKTTIYFKDGSLRDIYILNINFDECRQWLKFVNQNYFIEFFDRRNDQKFSNIDFDKVIEYWEGLNEGGVYASIDLEGVLLKCYFTDKNEIENDFYPGEIKSIKEHNKLINYLTSVSKTLTKPVIVTTEMQKDEVLIEVLGENVIYHRS